MVSEKSIANLVRNSDLTPKERREKASKAGTASAEAKRNFANTSDCARQYMTDDKKQEFVQAVYDNAMRNPRYAELLLKLIGEMPKDEVSVEMNSVRFTFDGINGEDLSE